jgi:hypothetical protein
VRPVISTVVAAAVLFASGLGAAACSSDSNADPRATSLDASTEGGSTSQSAARVPYVTTIGADVITVIETGEWHTATVTATDR